MRNAWRSPGAAAGLIVFLTVVVYLPVLRGGFVWDDRSLITENRLVKASDGPYRYWFTAETADYRPLTWSLWWLEWRLWGANATGYHVVNVLLHAVNAVLVWMILRRLKIPGAWLAAVVFGVHPVNVATGAWISEQKNTLSMLLAAVAVLLYLRFDEESQRVRTATRAAPGLLYASSLVAATLAVLSKTAVVMIPVVLLGCVWWRHGRVRTRDWLCSLPYFAASLVLALVTIVQHHRALGGFVVQSGGFMARLATAGWVPWFYLFKALVPMDLTVIYPKWEVDPSRWVSYVPGVVLIGGLILFWWKRKSWGRPLFFGLGYFVVMLFPVLGFFDQAFYRYSWVADHWQYYSIVGVIALAVAAGVAICRRMGDRGRTVGVLASGVVLLVLGMAAWKRSCVYADSETLWRDNVAKNPNAWVAQYNLGVVLRESHRIQEAIARYQQAARIKPDLPEAHYSLGVAFAENGRVQDAIGQYEQALRIEPHYVNAQNNLAWLLATLTPAHGGDPVRAVALAQLACKRPGDDVAARFDTLAAAYAAAGRFSDAIATAQRAIALAHAAGQSGLANEIEARLQLYRAGRSYRSSTEMPRP